MRKVKIFPAPHVEVRIHVSDEMEKDLQECRRMAEMLGDGKDCNQCSWGDVNWMDTGFCDLVETQRERLERENNKSKE